MKTKKRFKSGNDVCSDDIQLSGFPLNLLTSSFQNQSGNSGDGKDHFEYFNENRKCFVT